MKKHIIVLTAGIVLACGNSSGPSNPGNPISVAGTIWKMAGAVSHHTTVSQNPKSTASFFYGDSASIADQGAFGRYNYLDFFAGDSLKIYSSITPASVREAYTTADSAVYTCVQMIEGTDTADIQLLFTMDADTQLVLDFPSVEARYYWPSMGMTRTNVFLDLQQRDDFVATLDTTFQPATMDSLVYMVVDYYYVKQ